MAEHAGSSEETRPERSLGNQAAAGFVWLTAQTLAVKAVSMLGQIVLTWLLMPGDFGLIGLAYTVIAFVGLIQQAGIKELLVRRQRHFRGWATAAFWLSLCTGTLTGLLMLAIAPFGAWLYGDSRIAGLIAILAAAAPINALMVVPSAKLQIHLRFRTMALMGVLDGIGNILLTMLFAWQGFGAYSFAMPRPIMSLIELVVLWMIAGEKLHNTPHFRRWRFLVTDSGVLMAAWFFQALLSQEDYAMLGLLHHDKTIVGRYYFAFNLSVQTLALFSGSLVGVTLSAFSKLQGDVERQVNAFARATGLLAFVGVPLCLLQSAVAEPLIRLLFHPRWAPATPVLQILSVGMAFMMVAGPSYSLMQAQGRFKAFMLMNLAYAAGYLVCVAIGALVGAEVAVAVGAATCMMIFEPIRIYVGMRPARRGWRDVFRLYFRPMVMSVVAIAAGMPTGIYLGGLIGNAQRARDAATIVITVSVTGLVYILLALKFSPDLWGELKERVTMQLRRVGGSRKTGAGFRVAG